MRLEEGMRLQRNSTVTIQPSRSTRHKLQGMPPSRYAPDQRVHCCSSPNSPRRAPQGTSKGRVYERRSINNQ
jgi:hypothetical protein